MLKIMYFTSSFDRLGIKFLQVFRPFFFSLKFFLRIFVALIAIALSWKTAEKELFMRSVLQIQNTAHSAYSKNTV